MAGEWFSKKLYTSWGSLTVTSSIMSGQTLAHSHGIASHLLRQRALTIGPV